MRKSPIKTAALSLAAVLTIGALPLTSASAAERSYKEQEITAYMFKPEEVSKIKCLMYDDMPSVPYISIMDYLGAIYNNQFTISALRF